MVYKHFFGRTPEGQAVTRFTLFNHNTMEVNLLNYGAAVHSICVPDKEGMVEDITLGCDTITDYIEAPHFGGTIGRVANRIAGAKFTLNGKEYQLAANDGGNHLHGGKVGFSHRLWSLDGMVDGEEPALTLRLRSPDGEEGYPGNLNVAVTFSVSADNALSVHYIAQTDKATPINLTNHAYFNLGGFASGNVLDQVLWLDAESYLRGDAGLVPTGEVVPVAGTPFDFRHPKPIGRDFHAEDNDLRLAGGYDHCFNFTGWERGDHRLLLRGSLYDPHSGRKLELLTDSPCVQLYTANFLKNPAFPLRGGYPQQTQHAVCLETQKMPDSPNHPEFTDSILRPGEIFDYTTVFRFSAE